MTLNHAFVATNSADRERTLSGLAAKQMRSVTLGWEKHTSPSGVDAFAAGVRIRRSRQFDTYLTTVQVARPTVTALEYKRARRRIELGYCQLARSPQNNWGGPLDGKRERHAKAPLSLDTS